MSEENTIITERKESQSSLEIGKAGSRHKIYYWTVSELREKVDSLIAEGLLDVTDLPFAGAKK